MNPALCICSIMAVLFLVEVLSRIWFSLDVERLFSRMVFLMSGFCATGIAEFLWVVLMAIVTVVSFTFGACFWLPAFAMGMAYMVCYLGQCSMPDKVSEDSIAVFREVRAALDDGRIETWIQPIYDPGTGVFVSGECLCRLRRRDGSIMMPCDFIPYAERDGLIMEIETAMLRNMCACISDDRVKSSGLNYLEVNLSIRKGEQGDLLSEYASILSEYGVTPDKINLEITETCAMEKRLSVIGNMHAMSAMGFHFSIDDFGTGMSNFDYIMDMPFSIIKLDRNTVQKVVSSEKSAIVLRNVANMAHDLGMKVVAEGVETEDDLSACLSFGADYIQGYYFSEPLAISDFIAFLVNHPRS